MGRPEGAALETLDEPADDPVAVLEGEPWVPLPPLLAAGELDPAGVDPQVGDPAGEAVEATGRQEGVEEREAEGRLDRGGSQVGVDPLEDRGEAVELPRRVQVEQLVDQRVVAVEGREPVVERPPRLAVRIHLGRPGDVVVVDRRVALLASADLVAADDAAVVLADEPADRHRRRLGAGVGLVGGPVGIGLPARPPPR